VSALPEGFPRSKADTAGRVWKCRKDDEACTRTKPCPSCRGARNRRSGMRKQREARKALENLTGAEAARFVGQLGNEEAWSGLPLRVEVKSGAIAGPVWTKYAAAEAQAAQSKAIGDTRPFVFVAMGQRTTDGLVVCRLSELGRVVEALVNLA
jgi:hypothetical protein